MSFKRAKPPIKWHIDQEFQRETVPPCELRCFCFYNEVLKKYQLTKIQKKKKRRPDSREPDSYLNNLDLA